MAHLRRQDWALLIILTAASRFRGCHRGRAMCVPMKQYLVDIGNRSYRCVCVCVCVCMDVCVCGVCVCVRARTCVHVVYVYVCVHACACVHECV